MTITLESISELLKRGFIDAYDDPGQVKASLDAAIRERNDLWSKWQTERCFRAKAEAELAAMKARILPGAAKVEIADTDDPDGNPYGWVSGTLLSHNLIGKRVRLLLVTATEDGPTGSQPASHTPNPARQG